MGAALGAPATLSPRASAFSLPAAVPGAQGAAQCSAQLSLLLAQ